MCFYNISSDYGNKTNKASFTCSSHFDNINHQHDTFDIISEAQLRDEQNAQITPYFPLVSFSRNQIFYMMFLMTLIYLIYFKEKSH